MDKSGRELQDITHWYENPGPEDMLFTAICTGNPYKMTEMIFRISNPFCITKKKGFQGKKRLHNSKNECQIKQKGTTSEFREPSKRNNVGRRKDHHEQKNGFVYSPTTVR